MNAQDVPQMSPGQIQQILKKIPTSEINIHKHPEQIITKHKHEGLTNCLAHPQGYSCTVEIPLVE